MAASLRDSGLWGGASNPTLKRGANQHCAYGAVALQFFAKSRGRLEARKKLKAGEFENTVFFGIGVRRPMATS